MLITFSIPPHPEGAAEHYDIVLDKAHTFGAEVSLTWYRGQEVRFTLPGASTAQHEAVILALLTLDPRATIRTARARYAGLDDYKRQHSTAPEQSEGGLSTGENQAS